MSTKKNGLSSVSYEYLKDKILSYALAPGSVVSDYQVAAELGMSRAPVRESMMMLTADGLIETSENGKSVVTHIQLRDIVDILHVRRAIETETVRIIAENGWLTKEQEGELGDVFHKLTASSSNDSIRENYLLDDLFHQTITNFSGNNRIIQIVSQMTLQMQRARWLNVTLPNRRRLSQDEHTAIYNAIINRNEEDAVRAVTAHLKNSENAFVNLLTDHDIRQIMIGIYNLFNK